MTSHNRTSTLDGLPKQFVTAMRTLFDIMDDKKTGYVNFSDIENRWQDDESKGLPKGVLESLRKVTPPNGMLSFERFCAGLKICLLRNQVEQRQRTTEPAGVQSQQNRPPSAPLLDIDTSPQPPTWNNVPSIRPNPQQHQQRTLSMPQLLGERNKNKDVGESVENMHGFEKSTVNKPALYGPPKPPRSALNVGITNVDRAEIRTALQNWQMGLMLNDQDGKSGKRSPQYNAIPPRTSGRGLGDGKASTQTDVPASGGIYQKKPNNRRREPRRHTLQNGIDYNMLKRMKQIEQEKDVLMSGLNAIEKARDWYLKQIAVVQEKMKYLGRMGHVEQWTEAQQERLELQRARVLEVNRHLAALTDSWERGGLPLHMNLAVHHYPQVHQQHDLSRDITARLKQQNHLLTEEVNKKSDRISVLEREKAGLIRELLQIRANQRSGQEEAVF
ncbi:suppressor APC domain-containing protein 2 [Agrilus planipennis]|uniref:Suppressor APC domain-containing protein 2 n=1 Tax=Agrilus planipennis TaxID=224129 RepID=A0A1W4XU04_AGRPL|nr:suppressor APC domain-containing protein 2 [Agrilus planipennis]